MSENVGASTSLNPKGLHDLYTSVTNILPEIWTKYLPVVDSAFNRIEYQESSWGGKGRSARKADKLTAICEPII
jgi:hypothetical protein